LFWFAALSSVLAANCWKGFWPGVQGWGLPYWFVDYHDGFVRRGLAGQLFQMTFGRLPIEGLTTPVLTIHLISIGAVVLASAVLAAKTAAQTARVNLVTFFGFATWVFVAQVWPTLTYNVGYLDPLVIVIAVAAALLFRSGRVVETGVLIVAGTLIHEYFVFLLPFVLAAGLPEDHGRAQEELPAMDHVAPGPPLRIFAVLGAVGLVSAGLVTFASSPAASLAQVARMPLSADVKQILATVTFTQSIGQSVGQMRDLLFRDPGYTAFNGLFFLLPAFAASAGLMFWRSRPNLTNVLQVAAGLFPVMALWVAWDLSRLLVMADLTTGFLFLLAARHRVQAPVQTPTSGGRAGLVAAFVSVVVALIYGGLPLIYAYFPPGPTMFRYPLLVDQSVSSQRIKEPLQALWGQHPAASSFGDLTCKLTSDNPKVGPAAVCSPRVGEGEKLSAPLSLARGAYRFQFAFEPAGACAGGRVAVQVAGPRGRPVSAGFRLGGHVIAQLDVFFPDSQTVAIAEISGVEGDGCARVSRFTVTPLPGER
jgi:hypothetical protein